MGDQPGQTVTTGEKRIQPNQYTVRHNFRSKYKSRKCKRVSRGVVGNHWKSFSSFHTSLNALPCLLNADARTRPAEDLMRALCSMEMRFLLLKPSRCRPASRPIGSKNNSPESCSISLVFRPSLFSVCHLYSCCHCAEKLKGLLWQPQTLARHKTGMP